MSYPLGTAIPLQETIYDITGMPIDPITVTLSISRPDGGVESVPQVSLTHPSVGVFEYAYSAPVPGLYQWAFVSTGPNVVLQGSFSIGALGTIPSSDTGVVNPWCDADEVAAWPGMADVDQRILVQAAQAASELLYIRSGRQFPGLTTTTVRPTMQPYERSLFAWAAFSGSYGYQAQSMMGWSTVGRGWGVARQPPAVDLGVYPLRSINTVLIDGVTIPASEYRIDDHKWLVRVRPTITATPTERYGWPTYQNLDLPDTEYATFSVSCTYGTAPPASGRLGASALAASIASRSQISSGRNLPARLTSITRQGVNITVGDYLLTIEKGLFGVPAADQFVRMFNSGNAQRRPSVYSPDVGATRRAGA